MTNKCTSQTKIWNFEYFEEKQFLKHLDDLVIPKEDEKSRYALEEIKRYKLKDKFSHRECIGKDLKFNISIFPDDYSHVEFSLDFNFLPKEACYSFKFIIANRVSFNKMDFTLYKATYENNELLVEKKITKCIMMDEKTGLYFEDDMDLDKFMKFLKLDEILFHHKGLNDFRNMIFDFYSNQPGFKDVAINISNYFDNEVEACLGGCRKGIFSYFYYFGFMDYYLYMELMFKNNEKDKISKVHPLVTGKPVPKTNEVKMLHPSIKKLLGGCARYDDLYKLALELEANSQVGVNGLKILIENFNMVNNFNRKYSYDTEYKMLEMWRLDSFLESARDAFNAFPKLTPKIFMDKCIRAMFYYHQTFMDFCKLAVDYANMCKQLGVKLEETIPNDVIKKHDFLQRKMNEIDNSIIEANFKEKVEAYAPLADIVQSSELTILVPKKTSDLVEEGFALSHCVGSYASFVSKGISKIFFVRRLDAVNTPYVTVELDKHNNLIQARGILNSAPKPEVMKFIKDWVSKLDKTN
jgi:hypothetical protein